MKSALFISLCLFLITNIYSQKASTFNDASFLGTYKSSNGYVIKQLIIKADSTFLFFIETHMPRR
jgi:hypothetical protein